MRSGESQLKAWMVAGLDGDASAHSALLRAVVLPLRSFFARRVGDAGELEDLVQETLIAVHTRRESFDRDRPFTPWLFSIARYKMIDFFRRYRADVSIADLEATLGIASFEDAVNAEIDVDRLLELLPPNRRWRCVRPSWEATPPPKPRRPPVSVSQM